MDASLTSLSVVLPSYNEAQSLRGVVKAATLAAMKVADAFEVIVVDDGSEDRSQDVLRDLQMTLPSLVVVKHDRNRGYGAALRSGFSRAKFEWVFYTDADHQFDLGELNRLVSMAEAYDVVTGYRRKRRDGKFRSGLGRGWTWLTNIVLGVRVRDVNCAFKLIPRSFLEGDDWQSEGALIGAEILSEARAQGLTIGETGVMHLPRLAGVQTGGRFGVIAKALSELWSLWWFRFRYRRGRAQAAWLRKASGPQL